MHHDYEDETNGGSDIERGFVCLPGCSDLRSWHVRWLRGRLQPRREYRVAPGIERAGAADDC